jgi:hypothetical protein
VLKKIHNLRHRKVLACKNRPYLGKSSKVTSAFTWIILVIAEFMGFFSMFAVIFVQL